MPTYPRHRRRFEQIAPNRTDPGPKWLDMRALARVHASSEDPQHPIGRALSPLHGGGWRAASPGPQVIELRFRERRDLTHIRLVFDEEREARTQQFTITWSARRGEMHGEVVRQQFNFSPAGAVREIEDYTVALRAVETVRIHITPDISGGSAHASLTQCQLA